MFRTSPFLRWEKLRCTQQAKAHNEKTALADCFFEEFSYENVNLYKGKLAFLVSTILNAYINKCLSVVLLLIIVIYKINVYELCRFSKTFLKFQINYFIIR